MHWASPSAVDSLCLLSSALLSVEHADVQSFQWFSLNVAESAEGDAFVSASLLHHTLCMLGPVVDTLEFDTYKSDARTSLFWNRKVVFMRKMYCFRQRTTHLIPRVSVYQARTTWEEGAKLYMSDTMCNVDKFVWLVPLLINRVQSATATEDYCWLSTLEN